MTWAAIGVAGVSLVSSMVGGQSARRAQQRQLLAQQVAEADAVARQSADLAAQRDAAAAQMTLAGEREALSEQAQAEAIRQARMAGVEVSVDIQRVTGAEAADRRRRYFEEP